MNSYCLLTLIVPAIVLYAIAVFSPHWFTLLSTSYGIWWVRFCDNLSRCQVIVAVLNDQPVWYLVIQAVSVLSGITQCAAITLLLTRRLDKYLLPASITKLPAVVCLLFASVSSTMTLIILFYIKLSEPSPHEAPAASWSISLALASCVLQLIAALLSLVMDVDLPPPKSVCSMVCYKVYKYC